MQLPRLSRYGLLGVALAAAVAIGAEVQRPAAYVDTHAMRNTAASRIINDPRLSRLLSPSEQRLLAPLKRSNNDLAPASQLQPAPKVTAAQAGPASWITPNPPLAFNNDLSGAPQNTGSVTDCNTGGTVIGAYNDFRNGQFGTDISAWSISTNGGTGLRNSNLLPGIHTTVVVSGPVSGPVKGGAGGPASGPSRVYVPTAGDPVVRATESCSAYAVTTAANPIEGPFVSAVVVEKSTAGTLASCTSETACWPTRRPVVLDSTGEKYFSAPTVAVFPGSPFTPVWIGFTEFSFDQYGNATNSLEVVRCDSALSKCSAPKALETDYVYYEGGEGGEGGGGGGGGGGGFASPVAPSIALGSDGAVDVGWGSVSQFFGPGGFQSTMQVRFASSPSGSLKFGAPVTVTTVNQAIFGDLAGEIAFTDGFPVLAVGHVGGADRLEIAYGQCRAVAAFLCEHSETVLATSSTGAQGTWSFAAVDPGANSDFLPAITSDAATGTVLVGFLTTRFDPAQHRFDVLVVPVNPATGAQSTAIRVTATSIEPDADGLFYPTFGDYWQLAADNGVAWAHFTTTQRLQRIDGQGVPVPQQDNALARFTF